MKVAQLCLTLCDLMDHTVHGILQVRILDWVAYPFSSGSFWPRNRTRVSCIAGRLFTNWAIREAWCMHTTKWNICMHTNKQNPSCSVFTGTVKQKLPDLRRCAGEYKQASQDPRVLCSKVMSKPESSVEHSLLTTCREQRDRRKKCAQTRVTFLSCGHPCSRKFVLTKQNFGHTKLLSGRIADRIVFRSGWHWLHSLTHARLSQFEQQQFTSRGEN